jgi:hypothetical protein
VYGITGWVDWCRALAPQGRVVKDMTQTAVPVRTGRAGNLDLAARPAANSRLAAIDIEGGRPPMVHSQSSGDPVVLTFSGAT